MLTKIITLLCLPILLILSGCTFGGSGDTSTGKDNSSFAEMYQAHIKSMSESMQTFAKDIGYMSSYETLGNMSILADIPTILSGTVSTGYNAKVVGQDVDITFLNPRLSYETFLASGSMIAKQIAMISHAGDAYFRFEGLENRGLIEDSLVTVLEKYKDTWLSLTQKDILDTLSGSSEEEMNSYKLSQAISRMTLTDIESYLTKYPLLKEETALAMSGSLKQYSVSLHKVNIKNMLKEFLEKSTEKNIDPILEKEIDTLLEVTQFEGVIGLDPKDPKRIALDGTVVYGSGEKIDVTFDSSHDSTAVSFGLSGSLLTLSNKKTDTGYEFLMTAQESAKEIARLEATIKKDGKAIREINMRFSAPEQGLTLLLEHKNNTDGTFDGKLDAGIGNMTWKGKIDGSELVDFHITGAMIGSSLAMDLVPGTGGLLRGPLVVKSGDTTLFSALVGLRASKEELALKVDIESPEDPSIKTHAEINITAKRGPWKGEIQIPKDTKKFSEFADAISLAMPSDDSFTELVGDESMPEGPSDLDTLDIPSR